MVFFDPLTRSQPGHGFCRDMEANLEKKNWVHPLGTSGKTLFRSEKKKIGLPKPELLLSPRESSASVCIHLDDRAPT